jgi:hypothetical protein
MDEDIQLYQIVGGICQRCKLNTPFKDNFFLKLTSNKYRPTTIALVGNSNIPWNVEIHASELVGPSQKVQGCPFHCSEELCSYLGVATCLIVQGPSFNPTLLPK